MSSSDLHLHPEFISHSQDPLAATSDAPALPSKYGDDILVVLVRDPLCIFSYWEITPRKIESLNQQFQMNVLTAGAIVLRVYDLRGRAEPSLDHCFDVDINVNDPSRYIKLPEGGWECAVELGVRLSDGRFISFLSSNRLRMPKGRVSDKTDARWMKVGHAFSEEIWDRLLDIQNSAPTSQTGRSSAEVARVMAQRWEFLMTVYSGGSSGSLSSSSLSSGAWMRNAETNGAEKNA